MKEETADNFLKSVVYELASYKRMAEKAVDQINDEQLHWQHYKVSTMFNIFEIFHFLSARNASLLL